MGATELVAAGVAALEAVDPSWYVNIDPDGIDTEEPWFLDGCGCTLAAWTQTSFYDGLNRLGIDHPSARLLGFEQNDDVSYDELDAEWQRVVREKLEASEEALTQ